MQRTRCKQIGGRSNMSGDWIVIKKKGQRKVLYHEIRDEQCNEPQESNVDEIPQ
jgi:hypothetical protein